MAAALARSWRVCSEAGAAVQQVSVVGWYMDAEDFHQKYKARAVNKKRMSPSPVGKKWR
jgi:hypothetical protein